jgi:hypothetical protein
VIRRIVTSLFAVGALVGMACIDMSAPKGAASISALLLPSPSVVVGDTMRDSLGIVAPLRVIAYDANDAPIADLPSLFFITDSAAAAHLDKGNVVVGDKLGAIHLIGQVSGVQTTPVTVPITVAPTTLALTAKVDTLTVPFTKAGDTTSASTGSTKIAVTLKGKGDTASLGFVVKYELKSAPATIAGSTLAAVSILDDLGKLARADTTDATGASRTLLVRSSLLADVALQGGQKTDSVVVLVSTTYKGAQVGGSPIRVVIPLKVKFALP